MKIHKLKSGEVASSYLADSPVTEIDILRMDRQLGTHLANKATFEKAGL